MNALTALVAIFALVIALVIAVMWDVNRPCHMEIGTASGTYQGPNTDGSAGFVIE